MGSKNVIDINAVFNADISNLNGAIKQISKNLGSLTLPPTVEKSYSTILTKLKSEMENFESKTKSGLSSPSDTKALEASGKKITELYRNLQAQVESLGSASDASLRKMFPKSFNANITELVDKVNKFKKAEDTAAGSVTKEAETIEKLNNQLKKNIALKDALSKKKSTPDYVYNLDKSAVSKAKTAATKANTGLSAAEAKIEAAKTSGAKFSEKTGKLDGRSPENAILIKELKEAQAAVKATSDSYGTLLKNIGTKVSESDLTNQQLKAQAAIEKTNLELNESKEKIVEIGSASDESFTKLKEELSQALGIDLTSLTKGDAALKEIELTLSEIEGDKFAKLKTDIANFLGTVETADDPLNKMKGSIEGVSVQMKELTRQQQDVANFKNQLLDFFSIGSAVQLFKRAISSAIETVKELDATMTEAAVVTEFSVGDMWDKLPIYAKAANNLGSTINDLYQATTLYYQQGLKTNEAMSVGIETIKMAKIANMDATEATTAMTAALRGFNMEVNEMNAKTVNDVYSKLAAITASDTSQIATAMSKTASIASSANMELTTTSALLAQIIETTQEAPETAGTALKTIIARFTEVKKLFSQGQLTGEDTEGEAIDINKIDAALKTVGLSLTKFLQGTEGIDTTFLNLSAKWETLDLATQRYIATTAAGSRQQSRFLAMMSDHSRTMELVTAANNSAGASEEQFGKTLDSLKSKTNELKNAWNSFTMGLANNQLIKVTVDGLTLLLNSLNNIIDKVSGGNGIVKSFASLALAVGGFKIASSIFNSLLSDIGDTFRQGGASVGQQFVTETEKYMGKNLGKINAKVKISAKMMMKSINIELAKTKNVSFDGLLQAFKGTGNSLLLANKQIGTQLKNELSLMINGEDLNLDEAGKIAAMEFLEEFANTLKNEGNIDEALTKIKGQLSGLDGVSADQVGNLKLSEEGINGLKNSFNDVAGAMSGASSALYGFGEILNAVGLKPLGAMVMGLASAFSAVGSAIYGATAFVGVLGKTAFAAGVKASIGWGWFTVIAVGVAALTVGVIALFKAASNNTLEKRLERTEKAAKTAQTAASEARTAYDELLERKAKYTGLQETLENLVVGTDDWRKALIEANAEVMTLLDNYPKLAQFISSGTNGEIIISKEGWDTVEGDKKKTVLNTQVESGILNSDKARLLQQKATNDLQKTFEKMLPNTGPTYNNRRVSGKQWTDGDNGTKVLSEKSSVSTSDLIKKMSEALTVGTDLFEKDIEGKYSKSLLALADASSYTADQLWESKNSLIAYNKTLLESKLTIQAQSKAILSAGASKDTNEYKYKDDLITLFGKALDDKSGADQLEKKGKDYRQNQDFDSDFAKIANNEGVLLGKKTKENLQKVYASLHEMAIDEIPKKIADSEKELSEAIARIQVGQETIKALDDFSKRIETLNEEEQKTLTGLLSGNTSAFNIAPTMPSKKTLDEYAKKLGYETKTAMAKGMGYEEQDFGDLAQEDQITLAKNKGFKLDETSNLSLQQQLKDWAHTNQKDPISVYAQLKLDLQQTKEQVAKALADAEKTLSSKGIDKKLYQDQSVSVKDGLSKQVDGMGEKEAQTYVAAWRKVIDSSNLDEGMRDQVGEYLSNTGLESLEEMKKALDYLNTLDLDSSEIQNYWDEASKHLHIYLSSQQEALAMIDASIVKMSTNKELIDRLTEGTATGDDVLALAQAGVDVEKLLNLTSTGWEMVGDSAATVLEKLGEADYNSSKMIYEKAVEAYDRYKKLANGKTTIAQATTKDSKGNYTGDWENSNQTEIGSDLGVNKTKGESDADYLAKVKIEFDKYIDSLNNGKEILATMGAGVDLLAQGAKTSRQLRLEGGTNETQIAASRKAVKDSGYSTEEFNSYSSNIENKMPAIDTQQANESMHEYQARIAEVKKDQQALAASVVESNIRMDKSAEAIVSSWEEWSDVIGRANLDPVVKTTQSYTLAVDGLRSNMKGLLGIEGDLSESFLTNATNLELLKQAINGSKDALIDLKANAATELLLGMNLDTSDFNTINNQVIDFLNSAEYGDLELGARLDTTSIFKSLDAMYTAGKITADEMTKLADTFGFDVSFETIKVPAPHMAQIRNHGTAANPNFVSEMSDMGGSGGSISLPKITRKVASFGGSLFKGNTPPSVKSKIPTNTEKSGGGSSSKDKAEEKPDNWINSYDKFFNLTEKINESLRDRQKLEKEYEKLLEDRGGNYKELQKNSLQQLASLRREIDLQQQLQRGKGGQLSQLSSEKYVDKEGNEKTFAAMGVTQYASYDAGSGTISIDWSGLNAIKDIDKGGAVEAYISKLTELSEAYEKTQDTIEEMKDIITQIKEKGKSDYLELEERLYQALVEKDQKKIDEFQNLTDIFANSNDRILSSLQESVDLQRQIRDNTDTEQDIADKEAKLAFLQRDTSGAFDNDALELQKEIDDSRQSYSDSLITQELDRLSQVNEKATEQRTKQIEIMQAQLDYAAENGQYWAEVYPLMAAAVNSDGSLNNNAILVDLLKNSEAFIGMSNIGQFNWIGELVKEFNAAKVGQSNWKVEMAQKAGSARLSNGVTASYDATNKVWRDGSGNKYNDLYYNEQANNFGYNSFEAAAPVAPPEPVPQPSGAVGTSYTVKKGDNLTRIAAKYGMKWEKLYGDNRSTIGSNPNKIYPGQKLNIKKYKKGGLADSTGPAWLDGTKSNPELILNAKDTQNFIALKNVLSSLDGRKDTNPKGSGDNYYQISIEVEEISDDYDVDKLAKRIKEQITQDASYRNVNAISFLR